MFGFYVFAAIVGVGLLAFSFGDDGTDAGHDVDAGAGHAGAAHAGDIFFGFFRPRNLIFFLAAFGVTGMLLNLTGAGAFATAVSAGAMGLGAMALTHGVFRWLRRNESAVDVVGDRLLEGSMARVVLPVAQDSRGRIACSVGGREVHVVARLAPGVEEAIEAGREVVVVRMADGEAEISLYSTNE